MGISSINVKDVRDTESRFIEIFIRILAYLSLQSKIFALYIKNVVPTIVSHVSPESRIYIHLHMGMNVHETVLKIFVQVLWYIPEKLCQILLLKHANLILTFMCLPNVIQKQNTKKDENFQLFSSFNHFLWNFFFVSRFFSCSNFQRQTWHLRYGSLRYFYAAIVIKKNKNFIV